MHANQTPEPTRSTTPSEHHPALLLPVHAAGPATVTPNAARATSAMRPAAATTSNGTTDETEEAGYGYGV